MMPRIHPNCVDCLGLLLRTSALLAIVDRVESPFFNIGISLHEQGHVPQPTLHLAGFPGCPLMTIHAELPQGWHVFHGKQCVLADGCA